MTSVVSRRARALSRAGSISVVALMVLTMAGLEVRPAHAATSRVVCAEAGPGCDHTSIQAAVDAAGVGDTILVRPGTYRENVRVGVTQLTVCSAPSGSTCAPDASSVVLHGVESEHTSAILSIEAKAVRVSGFTIDPTDAAGLSSVSVGAKGVTVRDNVLVGGIELAPSLNDSAVDARLNDWYSYAWRTLGDKVTDLGKRNRVLQIPFKLPDGRIEPPLPVMAGPASHSGSQAVCEGWDADGDGFGDGFWDGACIFLTVQAAIDFAHPGNTLVLPASANPADPTPRFETIHIDVNNHGGTLVGGGFVPGGSPEQLDGLTLCSGLNDGGDIEPPPPSAGSCASTPEDILIARRGVILEGGRNPNLGGAPSGDTTVAIGSVADNVSLQNLTIQWSGSPDTDFAPANDVTGVAVSGPTATLSGNLIRMQGGGCTAQDLAGGGCYAPAASTGVDFVGSPVAATVTGNIIRADMPNPNDGTIGGKNGLYGQAPDILVEGNVFTGWAAHAAQPFGSGATVNANTFIGNAEGLGICPSSSGDPITAEGNSFIGHVEAVNYVNCGSDVENTLVENNTFGLTNLTALHVYPGAGNGSVPVECNDWGVYRAELIAERINDERVGNPAVPPVDFTPWTAPTPDGPPLACLLGPFAEFTTDLHQPGETSADDPAPPTPNTTRYQAVAFEDLSAPRDGRQIVSWEWNFGAGEGSELIERSDGAADGSTEYTFQTTGLKTVTLTVTDIEGITSLAALLINVEGCSSASPVGSIKVVSVGAPLFCTIQDAVDAATGNDTVLLPPSTTFFESGIDVNKAGLTICQGNAGMTACSTDPVTTVLNAQTVPFVSGTPFFEVSVPDVTLDRISYRSNNAPGGDIVDAGDASGLTVKNSLFNTSGGAINLDGTASDVSILSNTFTGTATSNLVKVFNATGAIEIGGTNRMTGCVRCIQIDGGTPEITDNVITTSTGSAPTHGILLDDTTGAFVSGNQVTGNNVGGGGGAHGIDLETSSAALVSDNVVSGAAVGVRFADSTDSALDGNQITSSARSMTGLPAPTYGTSFLGGSGNTSRGNTFSGSGIALRIHGSLNARSQNDTFTNVENGIYALQGGPAGTAPTGMVVRGAKFGGAATAIVFDPDLTDLIIDARLSDWGVYDHRLLPSRVTDNGTDNIALQLPFLLANGTAEPPLPSSGPATHSGTPALCNAHDSNGDGVPDAEHVGGVCRFLTAQAAINFAHAGGKVTVPMSQLSSPTPWFERITIDTNNHVPTESLDGLKMCATVVVGQCEPASDPARFGIFSSATWGAPPVARQGQAIRLQGAGSTSLFTRTFDGTGAPTVAGLTGLSVDVFLETGSCPASDPRIKLRIDTNADGTEDTIKFVYPPDSFLSSCPTGVWRHIDYLASDNWGTVGTATKASLNASLPAGHQVLAMNLEWDGAPGTVVWFDNQRYQNAFFREASDVCDGDARNPSCARETAQGGTVLDATGLFATGVRIAAPNVTLEGFTVRRTTPPAQNNVQGVDISGAVSPTIKGNAIRMEGAGCNRNNISSTGCSTGPSSIGILAGAASSGAQILNNTIAAPPASSDQGFGGTHGIRANLTGSSLIKGNTISGWGADGAQISGSGAVVDDNTFERNGDGIKVCGQAMKVNKNDFLSHLTAVVGCQTGTGLVMRDNNMDLGNQFAVRFPSGVTNLTIDARLNYWGVNQAQLLPLRVNDQQGALSNNKVLQTPFRPTPVP